MKNHSQLLEEIFNKALTFKTSGLPQKMQSHLSLIAKNAYEQKAVFTVLTTLFVHKIYNPQQDIRKHQSSMTGGFSGRTVDTKYVTPTLKKLGLPAMAESGWLTRSLEQPRPYHLDYSGKIRDKKLKTAFLKSIDYVQKNPTKAKACAVYLIYSTLEKTKNKITIKRLTDTEDIDINQIVSFLEKCFTYKYKVRGGSKIPVIAIYCMFSVLIQELKRYKDCKLKPLGSHTASDRTSKASGDIEILKNNLLEESIEVKLGKEIDPHLMRTVRDKIYKYGPKRYCVFSTKDVINKDEVNEIISEIKEKSGCQIILNGVIPTLKYYLRLISCKRSFLNKFLDMIEEDFELQSIHKEKIKEFRMTSHLP